MGAQPLQFPVGTVQKQNSPAWMANKSEDAVTFINNDPANTVSLGNVPNITVGGANTIALLPGSTITLPAGKTWYAVAAVGTQNLTVAPGSIQYSPFSTGYAQVLASIGVDIPAGTTFNGSGPISRPVYVGTYNSYDLTIGAHCASQQTVGAPYTMVCTITWYDTAAMANQLGSDTWEIWVGNIPTNSLLTGFAAGSGPMLGPYMTVQVINPSSTVPVIVDQLSVAGNSRTVPASEWKQTVPNIGVPGNAGIGLEGMPGLYNNRGVYQNIAASMIAQPLPASTSYWIALPLFGGTFAIRWLITQALANNPVLCQAACLQGGQVVGGTNNPGVIWNPGNTANAEETATLIAPKAPMYVVFNTTATAAAASLAVDLLGKPS